jgi:hypothetical protein
VNGDSARTSSVMAHGFVSKLRKRCAFTIATSIYGFVQFSRTCKRFSTS